MKADDVHFTHHALMRMQERGISREEVIDVLKNPIQTAMANDGLHEARGWIERRGKTMLLRVIYANDVVVSVITVVATSKLAKYGVTG